MQNNSVILVHHQKNGIMMAFAGGLIVDFWNLRELLFFLGKCSHDKYYKEKQITLQAFSGERLVICASDYSSCSDLRL